MYGEYVWGCDVCLSVYVVYEYVYGCMNMCICCVSVCVVCMCDVWVGSMRGRAVQQREEKDHHLEGLNTL